MGLQLDDYLYHEELHDLINPEIEGLVAGKLASFTEAYELARPYLSEDCFTEPAYREIYKIVKNLVDTGQRVTADKVWFALEKSDVKVELESFLDATSRFNTFRVAGMAQELARLAEARRLYEIGDELKEAMKDKTTDLADIYTRLREISEQQGVPQELATDVAAGNEVIETMATNMEGKKEIGTLTGFSRLDEFGGLHKGDLIVVAGDTGHGKTSFALSVTLHAMLHRRRVAYYSLEMSKKELMARILAVRSGVSASTQLYKRPHPDEYDKVYDAFQALPKNFLLFDDTATINFENITNSIRAMKQKSNIEGAVIDYIQILNVNNKGKETQEQMMASVARKLKNLAKELDIWIMALSQLNRNFNKPEPTLSRLRDSGQIAEAADVVILIYRPEVYSLTYSGDYLTKTTHNTAQIEVAKGRNIGLMKFLVRFDPVLTHFYETEEGIEDAQAGESKAAHTKRLDPITHKEIDEDLPY